jgi:phosphoribosylglycinamide formyltransferase-1
MLDETFPAAIGAPALPRRFRWPGGVLTVQGVLESWRETGPCRHGSSERYIRKHWWRVATPGGGEARLCFERSVRQGRPHKNRWWLYTVTPAEPEPLPGGSGAHLP